jgi:hypothetical protein
MKLTQEQVLGIARHILTFVGGIVIMKGYASEAVVTQTIGGILTLIGAVWSVVVKK